MVSRWDILHFKATTLELVLTSSTSLFLNLRVTPQSRTAALSTLVANLGEPVEFKQAVVAVRQPAYLIYPDQDMPIQLRGLPQDVADPQPENSTRYNSCDWNWIDFRCAGAAFSHNWVVVIVICVRLRWYSIRFSRALVNDYLSAIVKTSDLMPQTQPPGGYSSFGDSSNPHSSLYSWRLPLSNEKSETSLL